jgi:hypothetical protein
LSALRGRFGDGQWKLVVGDGEEDGTGGVVRAVSVHVRGHVLGP